jgi:fatty-acyl-CoA synthase/long-chain acyl-CoA synthetase
MHSGDIGMFDEEGYLYIVDRKKDLIISGGYNIVPSEIEAALYAHPAVIEAAVIAVPDDELGSRLRGFVALKPGATLSAAALQAHCGGLVPRYMVPESIQLRTELPKTSTGKTDRTRLAAEPEA